MKLRHCGGSRSALRRGLLYLLLIQFISIALSNTKDSHRYTRLSSSVPVYPSDNRLAKDLKAALTQFRRRNGPQLYQNLRFWNDHGNAPQHSFLAAVQRAAYFAGMRQEWDAELHAARQTGTTDHEAHLPVITSAAARRRAEGHDGNSNWRGLCVSKFPCVSTDAAVNEFDEDIDNPVVQQRIIKDLEQIDMDISRSLINVFIQDPLKKSEVEAALTVILRAIAFEAPHVGYAQGMNIVAGQLLLHDVALEDVYAITRMILFSDAQEIWTLRQDRDKIWGRLRDQIRRYMPQLHQLLKQHGLDIMVPASTWFPSLFASALASFGPEAYVAQKQILVHFLKGEDEAKRLNYEDILHIGLAAIYAQMEELIEYLESVPHPGEHFYPYMIHGLFRDWVENPDYISRDINSWKAHKRSVDRKSRAGRWLITRIFG